MTRALAPLACLFLAVVPARAADDAPPVIAAVRDRMEKFNADGEVSGSVTLVAEVGKVVHLDATGKADLAADRPMKADSVFWIASMTKPVTGASVLMMQDEGKLNVGDLVEKYIPAFADLKAPDGSPAKITILQLLTHTSGLSDISGDESRGLATLAEAVALYATKPMKSKPGAKWSYCQSGINTAARVVEIASGQPFAEFVEARFFRPLGMKDTTFTPSDEQVARLARSYKKGKDGKLEAVNTPFLPDRTPGGRGRFPAANGGLFSTAGDYGRFCRMLLNDGEFEGRRYLRPETVRQMDTIQTAGLTTGFSPGCAWGVGVCIVEKPEGVTASLAPGSFGHGGAYGTQGWIDPRNKRVYVLMIQRSDFPNSDASPVRRGFQDAAASAPGSASR